MKLVEQHLLRKTTRSGAQQWRQYNLYVDTTGLQWKMKEFTGRSKTGLAFKQEHSYGLRDEAKLDIENLIENSLNIGYVYIDRIVEKIVDTPFAQFTPIKHSVINFEQAKEANYLDDEQYRLIPIHGGVHCCIKIGYDTAFHVEAKTCKNIEIPIPEKIKEELVNMVTLCEYETFVLEAFVTPSNVSIIDVICVNGKFLEKRYSQRMALLSGLSGNDEASIKIKTPSTVDLFQVFSTSRARPYWYAVKSLAGNVMDEVENGTKLLPQYFVFNVMTSKVRDDILAHREKKQRVKLIVSKDREDGGYDLVDVGEMILPLKYPSHEIKFVEAVGYMHGKLIKPRVCHQSFSAPCLHKSNMVQFERLTQHWAGNLL